MSYLSFKNYGLIGNQATAILVSRMGSIDWCCLPYLDSPSHFGALLDDLQGGSFHIRPSGEFSSAQRYFQRTNVLETSFETPEGRGVLVDWMPIENEEVREPIIHRRIEVLDGQIDWQIQCAPRFSYGAEPGQAEYSRDGILFRGTSGENIALLRSLQPLEIGPDGTSAHARILLTAGSQAQFSWIWGRHARLREFPTPKSTLDYWRNHAHRCPTDTPSGCPLAGPWHDLVVRSGLMLKLMTAHYSGSLAESPTTSLPALAGGSKNWDYRFTWLRDSALAIQALGALGQAADAQSLFEWISDILIRDGAEGLQPVYTLDGGRYLPEHEIGYLNGYKGSRPVRVGNLSARTFSLDTFGHLLLVADQHYRVHQRLPEDLWPRLADIVEYVCQAWRRPDRGPWEVRSRPEHFVASKVMCWVALDRAISLAEAQGYFIPSRWIDERSILHRTICEQGFDGEKRTFVRSFGERELDASVLVIPLLGFLPPDDERIQGTMDAIQAHLSEGALILRNCASDGTPDSDGAYMLCSFWYVSCLALCGRADEASDRLAELCTYATPLGLFGEQINPLNGEPAGNFPSSAVHLALVNASLYVSRARGRAFAHLPIIGTTPQEDRAVS